ncbi:RbsD/FucU domain-containing protein [Sediminispirochaeta smaragdinae]|uniref:RbsD or FucU transport n=1 Tax=Sediminispirochaeta smaragdinae (strain DSM 11293 / JCM 15392 / SEBR 4228) TaxID=573413 RepID=E1RC56_SEDSS|nr:RbsD/FucU domain-containing protein [Sediminispirochaeta smaragdinae]ADK79936.1 RbsD or FucU transport [Sediminispirochaeta smaragdinae DSM 11293]
MLSGVCIHPGIMHMLSLCGHGDKILIADGNYPLSSKTGNSEKVYLGLRRGLPTVPQMLEVLCQEINIEKAEVMKPEGELPAIFEEFGAHLNGISLDGLDRYSFYQACCDPCLRLAIGTGEDRTFANILLTTGVA